MKKKPPPGATLIARLKEQRLAREAELARKQAEASGVDAPAAEPQSGGKPPAEKAPAEKTPAEKAPAPAAPKDATKATPMNVTPVEAQPIVTPSERSMVLESPEGARQTLVVTARESRDLIHREIDFDDLRPVSDDYFILTDEIRLAGRFAAVGLIAQGLRLSRLKEVQIYKDHYQTFEDYCRKEHQMSATYAYRLIRMAEMAEQVAQLGGTVDSSSANMPDPFEVMIGLGHRHLMALLPLEPMTAQELLMRGIPVAGDERVPISRATEKQIRDALKQIAPGVGKTVARVVEKKALVSEKQLIPALSKLVEMLEDWAVWLDGDPPEELRAARMGRGPLLNRLAKRFRTASGKIADSLESEEQ